MGDGDVEVITLDLVATISTVNIDTGDGCSCKAGHLIDLPGEAMPVIGITGKRHGSKDKLTTLASFICRRDGGLTAKLIAGAGLTGQL